MLPSPNRLRHEKDIKTLFAKGKSVFDMVVGAKFRKNDLLVSRFAVVVGVKVSKNAVERNRIRRKIREVIRLRLSEIVGGYDVVLLVRPDAVKKTAAELERQVLSLLKKMGIWKPV